MIIIIKVKTCTSSKQLCIKEILNYVWTVCICMLCNKYTQFSLCFKYDYGTALSWSSGLGCFIQNHKNPSLNLGTPPGFETQPC